MTMPLRLVIVCAVVCGLALFGPFVQSAQAPSPTWAVEPADFGPDHPPIGRSAFDALVARAGMTLTPEQKAGIHAAWGGIEAMQRLVRSPAPAPEAEPSTTFSTEAGR
jgi:hypothetical protein